MQARNHGERFLSMTECRLERRRREKAHAHWRSIPTSLERLERQEVILASQVERVARTEAHRVSDNPNKTDNPNLKYIWI